MKLGGIYRKNVKLLVNFDDFQLYELSIEEFENIFYFENLKLHVFGIVAIHSTLRGPALGGCRFLEYISFEDGLEDILRLAKAMTYKNAIVDLSYGGGNV